MYAVHRDRYNHSDYTEEIYPVTFGSRADALACVEALLSGHMTVLSGFYEDGDFLYVVEYET